MTKNNFLKRKKNWSFWFNISGLAVFFGLIIYFSLAYSYEITKLISDPGKFRSFILSYGRAGVLVFMLIQVIQVVIAIIPGEFIQIAGGYIYGIIPGTLYSLAGIITGYVFVFFIVRLFGFRLVAQLINDEELQKFYSAINSPGSEIAIFLLFLIPGIPKDILVYIAGLTPVKPVQFFIIITIARLPAMLGASLIGANIQKQDYTLAIIISAVSGFLFILGLVFRDRIISALKKIFS